MGEQATEGERDRGVGENILTGLSSRATVDGWRVLSGSSLVRRGTAVDVQTFQANRAKFSWEELRPYDGQWVGFSADGSRIVASAEDLADLDARIRAAGEDPQEVWLERIEFRQESEIGGAEFLL